MNTQQYSRVLLTYLLTPWCRVLLEKLTGLKLDKKFPAFHGTRRFITALTSVRHLSLFWASPIQSIYPHPTSWISSLILSTHLRLGLPSGLLPSGSPTKNLYTPLSSPSWYCNTKILNKVEIIKPEVNNFESVQHLWHFLLSHHERCAGLCQIPHITLLADGALALMHVGILYISAIFRGGAVGQGTALQAKRSRVRFP